MISHPRMPSRFTLPFAVVLLAAGGVATPGSRAVAEPSAFLPPEARNAKSEFEANRKAALLELDEGYIDTLSRLLEKYSREGNIDASLAIKREIELIKGEMEDLDAPAHREEVEVTEVEEGIKVPEGRPINITIKASDEVGVILEDLHRGDEIILQFDSGRWKSHGQLASENPDSLAISHGKENRLAIFAKKNVTSRLRPLAIVPPQTQQHPFTFTIPDEFYRITLRIHEDPDGRWTENPGSVVYRVQLKRAAP